MSARSSGSRNWSRTEDVLNRTELSLNGNRTELVLNAPELIFEGVGALRVQGRVQDEVRVDGVLPIPARLPGMVWSPQIIKSSNHHIIKSSNQMRRRP